MSCSPSAFSPRCSASSAYSFATPRGFDVFRTFTLANYAAIFDPANTVWTSFVWSLVLAGLAVAILVVVAYPIAYGLARVFGRWSSLVSLLFVFPLFVSENIRLYGWVLFFIKGGVLDGTSEDPGAGRAGRRCSSPPAPRSSAWSMSICRSCCFP